MTGIKAGNIHKEELRVNYSLASDSIRWDRYVYKLAHLSLGFVDVNEDSGC